jgi:hypothetical protein
MQVPAGFTEIHSLEEWDAALALEDAWDSTVSKHEQRVLVKEETKIEHLRLTPDGRYEIYFTTVIVQREVDVRPQFPSELASSMDWLTRIDDNGLKQALQTIHTTFGGDVWVISDTGMGIDHVPSAAPSDRYVGQQWRCAPVVDNWHTSVCESCFTVVSKTGACFCSDFPKSLGEFSKKTACSHHRVTKGCNWC